SSASTVVSQPTRRAPGRSAAGSWFASAPMIPSSSLTSALPSRRRCGKRAPTGRCISMAERSTVLPTARRTGAAGLKRCAIPQNPTPAPGPPCKSCFPRLCPEAVTDRGPLLERPHISNPREGVHHVQADQTKHRLFPRNLGRLLMFLETDPDAAGGGSRRDRRAV